MLDPSAVKTDRKFGGDVWNVVKQADALNIKRLARPVDRPVAQRAIAELGRSAADIDSE